MGGIAAELDREELVALVFDLRKVNASLQKRIEELEGKNPTERRFSTSTASPEDMTLCQNSIRSNHKQESLMQCRFKSLRMILIDVAMLISLSVLTL